MIIGLYLAMGLGHLFYMLVHFILMRGLTRLSNSRPADLAIFVPTKRVSVLISIRNEEDVIQDCLDCLEKQDYPNDLLEIILINDRSTDRTPEILKNWVEQHPQTFKLLHVEDGENTAMAPKKYALTKGAQQANGEIFLSTDADARFGPEWISALASSFKEDTGMVLGLTTYYEDSSVPSTLWGVQALELFSHSIVCCSFIANRFPINANANNMAYSKAAYDACRGMQDHAHILSGDDDFLLQQMADLDQSKILFSVHPSSHVETQPSMTVRQIWEQRKRWASKTTLYNPKQVFFLSCIYFYYTMILGLLLLGFTSPYLLFLGITSWVLKTGMDYRIMQKGAHIFSQQKLMHWFIPTSIVQIPLYILAVLFGSLGKFTWKGQKVSKVMKTEERS